MRLSRKLVLAGVISAILAAIAIAGNNEVVDFATPTSAVAGSNLACTIQVNSPTNVTFTSSPSGLSYTATVSGTGTQGVSVPTSGMWPPPSGSYVITATPTGGGVSKSSTVYISPIAP